MKEHKKESLNQIIKFRIDKLNEIRNANINPYPYSYQRSHHIVDLIKNNKILINTVVSIAGRVISMRKMGKAAFFNIQDFDGKIQIYVKKDNLPENIYDDVVRKIDIGDIIGTSGELFYTKTEELSIRSKEFTILTKSIRPLPNLKEKDGKTFFSFDDKELRYRKRHLDLIANFKSKDVFVKRSLIINSIRQYLNNNAFIEVETPILQPLYGGANAKPFKTYHNTLGQNLYLRIADELYLKRLIVGGLEKVYEIGKNFRNEGMDKNHNPEFTMLEFYKAYSNLDDMISLTESLIKDVAKKIEKNLKFDFNSNVIDLSKKIQKYDFYSILNEKSGENFEQIETTRIRTILNKNKVSIGKNSNRGKLLDKAFSFFVEGELIQPTFVLNYPIELSPLAKKSKNNDDLVERFELFIGGMEIANAFSELNDPIDQRKRLEQQSKLRDLGDDEAQTLDFDFIESIENGMPPTGGVGLGIDRLVMILTSQSSIKDVILFPAMRQEE